MIPVIDRFLNKVKKTDSCWIWTSGRNNKGYGWFWDGEKIDGSHRFSYRYYNGTIGEHLCVCHKCDNPSCVNPEHLFVATQSDNLKDMYEKNRGRTMDTYLRGEKHGCAKLLNIQVKQIREEYSNGTSSYRILANKYNVDKRTISRIIKHKVYKEVSNDML